MASAAADLPALAVSNLTKSFSGLVAVQEISFELAQNEMLGLIGPNGSGKTTMINLVSGALRPSAGQIRLYGDDIARTSAYGIARQGVARTFQIVRMLPSLSVLENVAAGGVFGHDRRWGEALNQRARDLLERVGLEIDAESPIDGLTYIDQKRVELARALISDPTVLLLDEWLAGLNPTELKTGIELIESLRTEGRTILIVEHVMDAIRSLCDRCVVMNGGIKIAEGTPKEALADPEVIRAYLGDTGLGDAGA